ncbi:MAG: hypothetical protein ACE5GS_15130 [Kiloniellaceae bacterium]
MGARLAAAPWCCAWCLESLPQTRRHGSPRRFCSSACRAAWWRREKRRMSELRRLRERWAAEDAQPGSDL